MAERPPENEPGSSKTKSRRHWKDKFKLGSGRKKKESKHKNSVKQQEQLAENEQEKRKNEGEKAVDPPHQPKRLKEDARGEQRPNLFIAIPIRSEEIRTNVKDVQEKIIGKEPSLSDTRVPVEKSHITLHVFNGDESNLEGIGEVMKSAVASQINPLEFRFKNIGHFGHRVLHTELDRRCDSLYKLWSELGSALKQLEGVSNLKNDKDKYSPHLTIMKTSKGKNRHMKIAPELYQDLKEMDFGTEENVNVIQLLSMTRPRTSDGYYHSFLEIPFGREDFQVAESLNLSSPPKSKSRNKKPDFLIAVQVKSPDVKAKMHTVQSDIVKGDQAISEALVPIEKSHVALHVFNGNEVDLREIEKVMREVAEDSFPLELTIKNLGTFGNKVVYAEVQKNDSLIKMWKDLGTKLKNLPFLSGIKTDKKRFTPHLTLMKFDRDPNKKVDQKIVDPELYSHLEEIHLGTETVTSIQLLSLSQEPDAETGYYHKLSEVPLKGVGRLNECSKSSFDMKTFGIVIAGCIAIMAIYRMKMK